VTRLTILAGARCRPRESGALAASSSRGAAWRHGAALHLACLAPPSPLPILFPSLAQSPC
jgi:hypothetical protein